MIIIAQLELELAYYAVTAQHVNHYNMSPHAWISEITYNLCTFSLELTIEIATLCIQILK